MQGEGDAKEDDKYPSPSEYHWSSGENAGGPYKMGDLFRVGLRD